MVVILKSYLLLLLTLDFPIAVGDREAALDLICQLKMRSEVILLYQGQRDTIGSSVRERTQQNEREHVNLSMICQPVVK